MSKTYLIEETNSKDVNSQEASSETRDVTSHGNGATEEAKTVESTERTEKSQVEPAENTSATDMAETGKTSVAPSSDSEKVLTTTEETGEATSSDSNLVNSQENNSETQDGTTNATSEESSESKEASVTSESESTDTQPSVEVGTEETLAPKDAGTTVEAEEVVTPAPQKVKVNVFYNFDKMKDIAGFLGDINGTPLEIAEGSTDDEVKVAVKSQVDAKKEELGKRGYTLKEDYVYQANGKDYNYVVTFSKAAK